MRKVLKKTRTEDIAAAMVHLTPTEQRRLYELIDDKKLAGEVLSYLSEETAAVVLKMMSVPEIVHLLDWMEPDDATDIIHSLPDDIQEMVIIALDKQDDDVTELLVWPGDTAGGIMSNVVFTVSADATCGEAVELLQRQHQDYESVFYLYAVDGKGRLEGVVSLRMLLVHAPSTPLVSVMTDDVIAVSPHDDQEEVARIVARYDLLGVPVVDEQRRILGMVTVDDVVDVIREEAAEDLMRMAGVNEDLIPGSRSVFKLSKQRAGWLFATCFAGIMADQLMISLAEHDVVKVHMTVLAGFIPVVMGMGGNVGVQSATITVRGIATGHVQIGGAMPFVFREIRVGMVLGLLYGVLVSIYALLAGHGLMMGVVVGTSVISAVAIGSVFGASLPVFLSRFRVDPAVATGPFVTSSVDLLGIYAYFKIASYLLDVSY